MNELSNYAKKSVKKYVRETVIFWILMCTMPFIPFLLLLATGDMIEGIMISLPLVIVMGVLAPISIERWKKHFESKQKRDLQFVRLLEGKLSELKGLLNDLFSQAHPRGVYWIEFQLDQDSLQVLTKLHCADCEYYGDAATSEKLSSLISVSREALRSFKFRGQVEEAAVNHFVNLIREWFSICWDEVSDNRFKGRTTFSVVGLSGQFDLAKKSWSGKSPFW